jgi:hypothetical protein
LLNATKSNSDFWPFWNRDLLYRFQNGGSNGLEGSKDCRSVGGHGNQHVRLRSAQVSLDGDDLPGSTSSFCFRTGAGVLQSKVAHPLDFEKLIGAFGLMSAPD